MKTEKNIKTVTTRIPSSTWEWLTGIGTAGGTVNAIISEAEKASELGIDPWTISQSIAELQQIRKRSKSELRGIFTPAEWSLMADSLNGTIITQEFRCLPSALIASVEDSDLYDGLGAKWSVDIKALIEKVDKLTAAQVDAVFTRVEEFWDDDDRDLEKWAEW